MTSVHLGNSLSPVGASLDIYSLLGEFISGRVPKREIDQLPGHPFKLEFLTPAAVLHWFIVIRGHE
jgi:hypothetical protein